MWINFKPDIAWCIFYEVCIKSIVSRRSSSIAINLIYGQNEFVLAHDNIWVSFPFNPRWILVSSFFFETPYHFRKLFFETLSLQANFLCETSILFLTASIGLCLLAMFKILGWLLLGKLTQGIPSPRSFMILQIVEGECAKLDYKLVNEYLPYKTFSLTGPENINRFKIKKCMSMLCCTTINYR